MVHGSLRVCLLVILRQLLHGLELRIHRQILLHLLLLLQLRLLAVEAPLPTLWRALTTRLHLAHLWLQ